VIGLLEPSVGDYRDLMVKPLMVNRQSFFRCTSAAVKRRLELRKVAPSYRALIDETAAQMGYGRIAISVPRGI
jgi:hypothetical protein